MKNCLLMWPPPLFPCLFKSVPSCLLKNVAPEISSSLSWGSIFLFLLAFPHLYKFFPSSKNTTHFHFIYHPHFSPFSIADLMGVNNCLDSLPPSDLLLSPNLILIKLLLPITPPIPFVKITNDF